MDDSIVPDWVVDIAISIIDQCTYRTDLDEAIGFMYEYISAEKVIENTDGGLTSAVLHIYPSTGEIVGGAEDGTKITYPFVFNVAVWIKEQNKNYIISELTFDNILSIYPIMSIGLKYQSEDLIIRIHPAPLAEDEPAWKVFPNGHVIHVDENEDQDEDDQK